MPALRLHSCNVIGAELALAWEGGAETFIPLEKLRRACPCATCAGEKDLLGNELRGRPVSYTEASFRLRGLDYVGAYGLQPRWADGHATGIYSYEYLQKLGQE